MKKILCLLLFFAGSANAGLMLNITEDTNNDVVFTFSGSSVVYQGATNYARNGFWFGDITDQIYSGAESEYSSLTDSFLAGNTTQGSTSTLSDIYLNGGIGHELGIRLDNYSILTTASDGDVVTWSGQVTLNLNFSDFMTGTWTGNRLVANGSDELRFLRGDGYTITIAAVPEPETYAMLLAGLGLMGAVARRRKQG